MKEKKWLDELPELCPPKDGMIKKTFGVAHYSWWRSCWFDVNKAKVIVL